MTLEITRPTPRLVMTLLEERYYCVPHNRPVVCRLWRMRTAPLSKALAERTEFTYAIGMESSTRRYLYCIGTDEAKSRDLYDRIVRGELSPIHLRDVVTDFLWDLKETAREFSERPLQTSENMV